ncbi:hypothetical protein P3X46_020630 [Hevea brasiliensis]|uniref:O-fucosyltransferase family protein n=1 Tax=Hevea brasiliensis TaxID=3981 RepID=A0ABQ9LMG4_HEVBR|nr:O-fucosyltransferase 15-like isoform X2 [Hevea brasiliensis]KAJ9169169.1 hypothetical protein P3X46_020630 [Hevea brasiliensis]
MDSSSDLSNLLQKEYPQLSDMLVSDRTESSCFFHSRSNSATSMSHQSSPSQSPRLSSSRLLNNDLYLDNRHGKPFSSSILFCFLRDQKQRQVNRTVKRKGGRLWYQRKKVKGLVAVIGLVGLFFFVNWFMLLRLQDHRVADLQNYSSQNSPPSILVSKKEKWGKLSKGKKTQKGSYERMLALAAHALAENKREPKDLWQEPFVEASAWIPCADQRNWDPSGGKNGYIMVTANGGMNQQRVAVCNAVVVARLLNSTLVVPKFMYSSVWRDVSQFSDIYQEEHFINYLTPDIRIVKELPEELRSLDLEAIGSIVTDVDIRKESKPSFYLKNILPILLKNRVVHFIGFGNRLAFDPIPFQLQRLRCRCNFHALQFVPKIQQTGALLLQRLRKRASHHGPLDHCLVGPYTKSNVEETRAHGGKPSRYLALHLRFEIDMVAHSLCEYGGGEEERKSLEAYREIHFPALALLERTKRLPSPAALRSEGLCPLTPEEAVLMLAALGFNRKTHIFVAGASIYGGQPRLAALTSLYPNLVTKEKLLSATELEPFSNFSSQLAALDFIACTAADAFAMTDSGSQLSSLVAGYRTYNGGGRMPTIRPNKRRLAAIFMKNSTIEWKVFEQRVRKAVRQTKHIFERPIARSVYRFPRCKECMCLTE